VFIFINTTHEHWLNIPKNTKLSPAYFHRHLTFLSAMKQPTTLTIPTIGYVSYKQPKSDIPTLKTSSLFSSVLNQFPHFPTLLPFLPPTRFGRVAKCMHNSLFFSSEKHRKSQNVPRASSHWYLATTLLCTIFLFSFIIFKFIFNNVIFACVHMFTLLFFLLEKKYVVFYFLCFFNSLFRYYK